MNLSLRGKYFQSWSFKIFEVCLLDTVLPGIIYRLRIQYVVFVSWSSRIVLILRFPHGRNGLQRNFLILLKLVQRVKVLEIHTILNHPILITIILLTGICDLTYFTLCHWLLFLGTRCALFYVRRSFWSYFGRLHPHTPTILLLRLKSLRFKFKWFI